MSAWSNPCACAEFGLKQLAGELESYHKHCRCHGVGMLKPNPSLLSFEQFMQQALYDPAQGYYTRAIATVGARGDFSTSVSLGDNLARRIAAWIKHCDSLSAKPLPLLEIGGGSGALARQLRGIMGNLAIRRRGYVMLDSSAKLRRRQRLANWPWMRHAGCLPQALQMCGGRALIFANELVDAFACRVLVRQPHGWSELWVDSSSSPWREKLLPLQAHDLPDSTALKVDYPLHQRIEVQQSFRGWMQQLDNCWQAGRMLLIDYGSKIEQLYHRRPQGTLRGYYRHECLQGDGVYRNAGRQDLTCDVNFSDLLYWGKQLGWESGLDCTQAEFLREIACNNPAQRYLAGSGVGEAFRVLEFIKSSEPQRQG